MLNAIAAKLGTLVRSTWVSEVTSHATLVKLYRDYADGEQRSFLTARQRTMLNITNNPIDRMYMNYCDLVVQKMTDRLTVSSIAGDTEGATKWSTDLLTANRFDGLQADVHEAAIRDGVTFVMVDPPRGGKEIAFAHELAYDGDVGMIAVWDRMGKSIVAAVKIWSEPSAQSDDAKRVNLYFDGRIEKYSYGDSAGVGSMTAVAEPGQAVPGVTPWVDKNGNALPIPVIAFANRKKQTGRSELAAALPLQDALNRALIDLVMAGGLTAFRILVALGFEPPEEVSPGSWVVVKDTISKDQTVDVKVLESGDLKPIIDEALFLIDQLGEVTQTPLRSSMGGDTQSGEALKQREVGLLGKIGRFQVKVGNAWEDTLTLAARLQAAFGSQFTGFAGVRWSTQWDSAEVRDDTAVVDNAIKIKDIVGDQETLNILAPVYKWDAAKIKQILADKQAQTTTALATMLQQTPNFNAFNGGGFETPEGMAAEMSRV